MKEDHPLELPRTSTVEQQLLHQLEQEDVLSMCKALAGTLEKDAGHPIPGFSGMGLYWKMVDYAQSNLQLLLKEELGASLSGIQGYLQDAYAKAYPQLSDDDRNGLMYTAYRPIGEKVNGAAYDLYWEASHRQQALSKPPTIEGRLWEVVGTKCGAIAEKLTADRATDPKEATVRDGIRRELYVAVARYALALRDAAERNGTFPRGDLVKECVTEQYRQAHLKKEAVLFTPANHDQDTRFYFRANRDAGDLLQAAKEVVAEFVPSLGHGR